MIKLKFLIENEEEDAKQEWQRLGTRSKYFKKWFANSRATLKSGKPAIVYHGTPDGRFLDTEPIFKNSYELFNFTTGHQSHFFTDTYAKANSYANEKYPYDYQHSIPKVVSAYLSIQNPLEIDAGGDRWLNYKIEIDGKKFHGTDEIVEYAKSAGYDGVIIRNVKDYYNNRKREAVGTVYAVFDSSQIKSLQNIGTFDANNKNIFK